MAETAAERLAREAAEAAIGGVTVRIEEKVDRLLAPAATKYSTSEVEDYGIVRRSFADMYGFTRVSDITWRINSLADVWKDEHNGVYPSSTDFLQWDIAHNSIATFAAGYSNLAPSFTITQPDGTWTRYHNDPVRGPLPSATQNTPDFEFLKTGVQGQHIDVIPEADLPAILAGLSPIAQPRSGSSGGVGRTERTFDRRQLEEAAMERWRGLLLEEPEDDELTTLVSDYIKNANAFWIRESGSLDFDTFVTDRIRQQERHSFLYSKKPGFQSEAEYMGGFRNTVSQFGLSSTGTLRELEAGASSGVGLAGFGERVERSREARTINQGSFSQRLAGSLAQTGLGGT